MPSVVAASEEDGKRRRLPMTRGDCVNGPRPCPYVSCRYHLYLDVTSKGGLKLNFPDLEPHELNPSCALDVADSGVTLQGLGRTMNVTKERARQLLLASKEALREAVAEQVGELDIAS